MRLILFPEICNVIPFLLSGFSQSFVLEIRTVSEETISDWLVKNLSLQLPMRNFNSNLKPRKVEPNQYLQLVSGRRQSYVDVKLECN